MPRKKYRKVHRTTPKAGIRTKRRKKKIPVKPRKRTPRRR